MIPINLAVFSCGYCHGKQRRFKPKSLRHSASGAFCLSMISAQTLRVCREGKPVPFFRIMLVPVDPVDALQPLAHGFLQVVAGFAELRVAAGDEYVLLAAQVARLSRALRFLKRPGI